MFMHIMLDVETLGIKHNAVTFQVAGYAFNTLGEGEASFSRFIRIDEQVNQLGSTTDASTESWWRTQPLWPEMQKKMAEESISLEDFRKQFRAFIRTNSKRGTKYWANGICFDIPKIEHLLGGEFCKFWDISDFRTMKNIHGNVQAPPGDYGPAHDALADCKSQAAHLRAILSKIYGYVD